MAKKTEKTAVLEKPEVREEAPKQASRPVDEATRRILESREVLKHPLPAGQKLFEAPDGFVAVGESSQEFVFYTPLGGHEIKINPRRA